jgi:hypothetical protein
LFAKKIGSGEMVQTWDVESNYEQGRESGSMQNPNGCLHFTMEPLNTLRNLTPCFTVCVWWDKMCFFPLLENLDCKISLLLFELFSLLDRLHLWIVNKINNYIIHKQLDYVTSFNFGFLKKIYH